MKTETLAKAVAISGKIEFHKEKVNLLSIEINRYKNTEKDLILGGGMFYSKVEDNGDSFNININNVYGFRATAFVSMLQDERIYNEEKLIKYEKELADLKDE